MLLLLFVLRGISLLNNENILNNSLKNHVNVFSITRWYLNIIQIIFLSKYFRSFLRNYSFRRKISFITDQYFLNIVCPISFLLAIGTFRFMTTKIIGFWMIINSLHRKLAWCRLLLFIRIISTCSNLLWWYEIFIGLLYPKFGVYIFYCLLSFVLFSITSIIYYEINSNCVVKCLSVPIFYESHQNTWFSHTRITDN